MKASSVPLFGTILLALIASPAAVFAADDAPDTSHGAYNLPEIVVRATPHLQPSSNLVREADTDDFDALNAHTVADVLTHSTGLSIQRGTTGDSNVLVRGFRHRDVLFLFDGIPIASVFEGTLDMSEVAIDNVSKIKMIKSAPSVIYGTNAMGGVIDIIPKSGTHPEARRVGVEIGEDSRVMLRGSYGGGGPSASYFASASFEEADNFSLSDGYTPQLHEDGGERENTDLTRRNVFLHLRTETRAVGPSSLYFSASDNDRGYAPQSDIEEPDFERLIESRRITVGLANDLTFAPVSVRLHYNGYRSTLVTYEDSTFGAVDNTDDGQDHAYGATIISRLMSSERNRTLLSAAYEQDRYENDSDPEFAQDFRSDCYTVAIEDEVGVTDRLRVVAGGLLSRFEQPRLDKELSAVNGQVVLGYQLSSTVGLNASAARRTRFPKLRELYRDRYGNPELKEQRANNYEVGIAHASRSGIESDLTLFLNEIDGLIDRADRRSPYENLDDVRFRGIEAASGAWFTHSVYGRLGYMLLDADETLEDGSVRQLRRLPRHNVNAELRYRPIRTVELSFFSTFVSELYDLDADDKHTRLPDYFLLGTKTSVLLRKGLSAYAAASNVTDEDYMNRLGFPLEGRSVRFGSTLSF